MRRYRARWAGWFAWVLLAGAVATPAMAQQQPTDQELDRQPMYNAATKSYFEVLKVPDQFAFTTRSFSNGAKWEEADKWARSRIFRGARGRLAVITSQETTNFIIKNMPFPERAWIGLKYWCKVRKATWVTGEEHRPSAYHNWGRPWDSGLACKDGSRFNGVYIDGRNPGLEWFAQVLAKQFYYVVVEYPTGKE